MKPLPSIERMPLTFHEINFIPPKKHTDGQSRESEMPLGGKFQFLGRLGDFARFRERAWWKRYCCT